MAKYKFFLTGEERNELQSMCRKYKLSAEKHLKAVVLLASGETQPTEKLSARELSARYNCNIKTVERIRKIFCLNGMQIFEARPRAVRNDKVYDARVEAHLMALCCEKAPSETGVWILQLLCDALVHLEVLPSVSRSSVCQLLKKMNLSPF